VEALAKAISWIESGEEVALATVIRVSGSTPRHVGAKLAVTAKGQLCGTVGGGRVEHRVTTIARAVAQHGKAQRHVVHLVRDLGMCCGGTMEFWIESVAPSVAVIQQALTRLLERKSVCLITPFSQECKWIMDGNAVGRVPRYEDSQFVENLVPRDRLIVFGLGHVARELAPLAHRVGFEVFVCDDGETGAIDQQAVGVSRTIASFEVSDVVRAMGTLGVGDYVVIVTRDHALDERILEHLLPVEELSYLGLIGSLGKIGRFRKRLESKSPLVAERWAQLSAPIGVDIDAETPQEIAVSIVAQLIATRAKRRRFGVTI